MKDLVIGGTSGLGLAIAKELETEGGEVIVTGRHDPQVEFASYQELDLGQKDVALQIGKFVTELPPVRRLIYAAGYYQEGRITDLTNDEIETMINVGGRGLVYLMKSLLEKQDSLDELVTITSTSQWTPRKLEPVYNFAKAAAGHFSNAMAEDGRVGKVLVAGPAGMKTDFWEGVPRDDIEQMLDPEWVAKQVMGAKADEFKYKYIRILREPQRVELVEKR